MSCVLNSWINYLYKKRNTKTSSAKRQTITINTQNYASICSKQVLCYIYFHFTNTFKLAVYLHTLTYFEYIIRYLHNHSTYNTNQCDLDRRHVIDKRGYQVGTSELTFHKQYCKRFPLDLRCYNVMINMWTRQPLKMFLCFMTFQSTYTVFYRILKSNKFYRRLCII